MSITQTLSNAFSGLTAASRHAEIVSNNVSNVATDGYARREIELSARVVGDTGNGVRVDGTRRVVDQALLRDRRQADASAAQAGVHSSFHASLEKLIGTPDEAASLSGRVAKFESSLLEAASRPDSQPRLAARPVATVITVGVASPSAQGQATTNTAIASCNASPIGVSAPLPKPAWCI